MSEWMLLHNYLWTDGVSRGWSSDDGQLGCGVFG